MPRRHRPPARAVAARVAAARVATACIAAAGVALASRPTGAQPRAQVLRTTTAVTVRALDQALVPADTRQANFTYAFNWNAFDSYRRVNSTPYGREGVYMQGNTNGSVETWSYATLNPSRYSATGNTQARTVISRPSQAPRPGDVLSVSGAFDTPGLGLTASTGAQGRTRLEGWGRVRLDAQSYDGADVTTFGRTPFDTYDEAWVPRMHTFGVTLGSVAATGFAIGRGVTARGIGAVTQAVGDPFALVPWRGMGETNPCLVDCRYGMGGPTLVYSAARGTLTSTVTLRQELALAVTGALVRLDFNAPVRTRATGGAWGAAASSVTFDAWSADPRLEIEYADGPGGAPLVMTSSFGLVGSLTSRTWLSNSYTFQAALAEMRIGADRLPPVLSRTDQVRSAEVLAHEATLGVTFGFQTGSAVTLGAPRAAGAPPVGGMPPIGGSPPPGAPGDPAPWETVPEPGTWVLLAAGLAATAAGGARRRATASAGTPAREVRR